MDSYLHRELRRVDAEVVIALGHARKHGGRGPPAGALPLSRKGPPPLCCFEVSRSRSIAIAIPFCFFFSRETKRLQTCPASAGERHRVRGVRSDRPGMVAVGSARATMKSPAMAASARAGRRLESGCGRKPGRHCPRGEGPMWSNRPSFRFAPVLKGRGRAPDRRPGGGRSTACKATGVPWTADQAWGLVVGVSIYLYLYL